ncbi:MAG: sugar phosphate isomerase/epimerase [candidate division WOR-3 bacterium]|nr:sugar phosphate isomerase/epimerase [candidate division WOR-3 bacterium]MCX7756952.1 sugar phosphate isomerase/epimerase [candidate division WOR-3 bacterium]MDW7987724.1 sugar phosphate isomerase/epimerase [candidate division WOR-3 bacterium]
MIDAQKILNNLGIQILFDFSDIKEAIDFALDNQIKVLELNLNNIYFAEQLENKNYRQKLKRYLKNKPIRLQFHAQEGLTFFMPQENAQKFIIKTYGDLMKKASEIGAYSITFHLGTDMSFGMTAKKLLTYEVYPMYYKNLIYKTLTTIKKQIPKNLYLCLENVGGFRYPFVLELIPKLLSKNFCLTLDIGHINRFKGEDKLREDNFFHKYRRYIKNVHIHDNDGAWDQHNIIGEGNIDFKYYFNYLSEIDTSYVFEVRPKESALECLKRFFKLLDNWQIKT